MTENKVMVGGRKVLTRGTIVVDPGDDVRIAIREKQDLLVRFVGQSDASGDVKVDAEVLDDGATICLSIKDSKNRLGYAYSAHAEQAKGPPLHLSLYVHAVGSDAPHRQMSWTVSMEGQ